MAPGPGEVKMEEPRKPEPSDKERIAALENEVKKLQERMASMERNWFALRANQKTGARFGEGDQ